MIVPSTWEHGSCSLFSRGSNNRNSTREGGPLPHTLSSAFHGRIKNPKEGDRPRLNGPSYANERCSDAALCIHVAAETGSQSLTPLSEGKCEWAEKEGCMS